MRFLIVLVLLTFLGCSTTEIKEPQAEITIEQTKQVFLQLYTSRCLAKKVPCHIGIYPKQKQVIIFRFGLKNGNKIERLNIAGTTWNVFTHDKEFLIENQT